MKVDVSSDYARLARFPHNLFMLNLALVHLLMTPAVIAIEIGTAGILLPLIISLSIMLYTFYQAKKLRDSSHWFIVAHWELAGQRYRLMLIAYAITASLILAGWLLALASPDANMQQILRTVFIRIAIMPTLIMVMINFYLESSAINMASNCELPDSFAK